MVPEVEGPVYEWHGQVFLAVDASERMWIQEGQLVRRGLKMFEVLEATSIPGVGESYLVRVFRPYLNDEDLEALANGDELQPG